MPGIMSGLEPVRLKDGGFPDLTGDGKVTRADILKGRGVPGLANGGDPRFMSREGFFSMRDDPERLNARDITDLIFDPNDPLDYAAAGMAATGVGLPAAAAMKTANTGRKVLGGIGATLAATPLVREGIEFMQSPVEYTKGILDLVTSAPEAAGSMGEIAQALKEDPKGTASIIYETVSETSGYPVERADGGIMGMVDGGILPASAKTPTGRKKKAVMTVMDMMDEIAEKLPAKPKKKTKKEKDADVEAEREIIENASRQREAEVIAQQARLERARANRANQPTTPQPVRTQTPVRTDAPEVGPPRPVPSQGANVNKAAGDAFEGSSGAAGPGRSILQQMKDRPIAGIGVRNPIKTAIAGGVAAAVLPVADDEPTITDQPSATGDGVGGIGSPPPLINDGVTITAGGSVNTNPGVINNPAYDPGNDNSLAYYVREELKGKGFQVDEAGEFVTKPKFFDYIKALPSGYTEKVSNDQDFAKKMMAGFLNMMRPVEGYVPINPVVAFGDAYFGEETRQADMLSAEAKTLQFLKRNPRYQGLYKKIKAAEAGYNLGEIDAEQIQESFELLKGSLMSGTYTSDQYDDFDVYYGNTKITPRELGSLLDMGVKLLGDPNFRLQIRTAQQP